MEQAVESAALERRLVSYLAARMPEAREIRVTLRGGRLATGYSRENWPFDAEWLEGDRPVCHRLILRRDPPGGMSVIETDREAEFHVLRALAATNIPAPRAHWIETEGEWLDRPFVIMERCDGTVDPRILTAGNSLGLDPDARLRLAERYCQLLAGIHGLDWRGLGLGSVLPVPSPNAAEVELERACDFVMRASLEPQPELAEVICWLERRIPSFGSLSLVHGDFRPENSIVDGERVVALLDWELARITDPMADLAWYTMPIAADLHFIPGRWEKRDFLRRYGDLVGAPVDEERLLFFEVLVMLYVVGITMNAAKSFLERRSTFGGMTGSTIRRFVAVLWGMIGGER